MTMKRARATAVLGALFVLFALVVPGCDLLNKFGDDWANEGKSPNACCPAGDTSYTCTLTLVFPYDSVSHTQPQCGVEVNDCFRNSEDAEAQAPYIAAKRYWWNPPKAGTALCWNNACNDAKTIGPQPQDYPTCASIMAVDAGAASCVSGGTGDCNACLNLCCAEYAACSPAGAEAECNGLVGYWNGSNPNWMASAESDAAMQLEACFESVGCTGSCGQPYVIHADAGAGGGSGGSGTGGGDP